MKAPVQRRLIALTRLAEARAGAFTLEPAGDCDSAASDVAAVSRGESESGASVRSAAAATAAVSPFPRSPVGASVGVDVSAVESEPATTTVWTRARRYRLSSVTAESYLMASLSARRLGDQRCS